MVDFEKINKRISENCCMICDVDLKKDYNTGYDTKGWHPEYNYDNKCCLNCNRKHMKGLMEKGFL